MYGMGDAIRGMYDVIEEKDKYIQALEDFGNMVVEWYASIEEPGNIPNHNDIHHIVRMLKRVIEMKGWK
jgi:hypothetical protein